MFVAKFNSTNGAPFKADKNGNYPYVGTINAGVARNAIMNGTMFAQQGLQANKLYLCDNVDDTLEDGTAVVNVEIISEISAIEFLTFRKDLGAGKLQRAEVAAEAQAPVNAEA